jgi:hypothetical protein
MCTITLFGGILLTLAHTTCTTTADRDKPKPVKTIIVGSGSALGQGKTDAAPRRMLVDPQPTYPVTRTLEKLTGQPADTVTPLDRPDATKLALPYQPVPLSIEWRPWQQVTATKVVLGWEPGGNIADHFRRFLNIRAHGLDVEIQQECYSACTLVTNIFPKDKLCFGPRASLNFHKASDGNGSVSMWDTERMFSLYPADIQAWIDARGGIEKLPQGNAYWSLPASELWKMGYRKCP